MPDTSPEVISGINTAAKRRFDNELAWFHPARALFTRATVKDCSHPRGPIGGCVYRLGHRWSARSQTPVPQGLVVVRHLRLNGTGRHAGESEVGCDNAADGPRYFTGPATRLA